MCRRRHLFNYVDQSSPISSDSDLNIPNFVQKRETSITELVKAISQHSQKRLKSKFVFQIVIMSILLVLLVAFALTTIFLIFKIANGKIENISIIVVLLTSTIVSFVTSIFTTLHIIVKYIFPSKEEEHSMEILKIISASDLKYLDLHSRKNKVEEIPVRDDNEIKTK